MPGLLVTCLIDLAVVALTELLEHHEVILRVCVTTDYFPDYWAFLFLLCCHLRLMLQCELMLNHIRKVMSLLIKLINY